MSAERHEFDFEGEHYTSLNGCIAKTGRSAETIRKERTNLKKVKHKHEIILDTDKKKAKAVRSAEALKRGEMRRKVEEYHARKAVDDWFDGLI